MLIGPTLALPTLTDNIAYLSRPEAYPDGTSAVEVIETHMSYVFLVDRLVYKLKKSVRYPFLDFSTLEARRFNCEERLRLNKRLARNVYLAVVPLTVCKDGLRLAGPPVFIDCLEFNHELRIVDPADELASLAMECEFLGAGDLGKLLFDTYESITGDAPGIAGL